MATIHDFPVELIAQVCENLDVNGLRKARLISKSIFEPEARKLLFREVVLYANVQSLEKLQQIAANFSSLVRVFTYSGKMVRFYFNWVDNFYEYLRAVADEDDRIHASPKPSIGHLSLDNLREHHTSYRDAVHSQGSFFRDDCESRGLLLVSEAFPALETVIYDSGYDLGPVCASCTNLKSDDGLASVTDQVLIPCDAAGGYKRHSRQLEALSRAIASRNPLPSRMKRFATFGVELKYLEQQGQDFDFTLAPDLKELFAEYFSNQDIPLSTTKMPSNMLTCCPNLELLHLRHVASGFPGTALPSCQRFSGCIGETMQNNSNWGCRISTTTLQGFLIGTKEFKDFLIRCSPTIRSLSLSNMVLFAADETLSVRSHYHLPHLQHELTDEEQPGCWPSMFDFMAINLCLTEFKLSGEFRQGYSPEMRLAGGDEPGIRMRIEQFVTGQGPSPFRHTGTSWECDEDLSWKPCVDERLRQRFERDDHGESEGEQPGEGSGSDDEGSIT